MHKKLFYMFVILAMLFGAFGMMGQGGVTPVFAAQGFNPGGGFDANVNQPSDWTPLPFYDAGIGAIFSNTPGNDFHGLCDGVGNAGVGIADAGALEGVAVLAIAPDLTASTLRIRVNPDPAEFMVAAVVAQADITTPLGCRGTGGVAGAPIDLVVAVPANTALYVVLGTQRLVGPNEPLPTDAEVYIQRTLDPSGGLIVQTDNVTPGAEAQVYNRATGLAQWTLVDSDNIAWFDVPAGSYNLGFADSTLGAPLIARYTEVLAGGWVFKNVVADTTFTFTQADLLSMDPDGNAVTLNWRARPDDAQFGYDFNIGLQVHGTLMDLTPGPWTLNAYRDFNGAPDYNLFTSQMYPTGSTTVADFRLQLIGGVSAARIRMCVPVEREEAVIHMEVPPFDEQVFSFHNGGLTSPVGCPLAADGGATQGGWMYVTTNIDYNAYAEVHETSCGQLDQYFLAPRPYPFPITTSGVLTNQWSTIFADRDGDTFFSEIDVDGPFAGGLIGEFVQPVDNIEHTRATWHDASGNLLYWMIIDGEDEFPQYDLFRGLGGRLLALAEDWETTSFDYPDPLAGRYAYTGVLNTGGCNVTGEDLQVLFAVSPQDTRMLGHWAWSWVMALYEIDYTVGIDVAMFGPDTVMSRAEMATFLSRVLSDISTLPVAPAGAGDVFTDVDEDHWAVDHIEFLESLAITGGYGDGRFGPADPVSRAEMSKFIQLTFRTAAHFGWAPPLVAPATPLWDVNQNVRDPGTTFVDVPAEHWANLWIEEMWFDGLTSGCRTEMSGLAFIHYFCPEESVTRGQMAKFINTALRPDQTVFGSVGTQWVWPVLSPER